MSTYSFKITKGIYQLTFSTTDKELVAEQFALWVRKASEYVKNRKVQTCKEMVNTQINAEKEITQKKIDEQIKRTAHDTPEINDTVSRELDSLYSPEEKEKPEHTEMIKPAQEFHTQVRNFESTLSNSMNTPQTDMSFRPAPSIKKDNAFINYVGDRKIERKIDYLLLAAYYFTQYEQKPRFTLKQLNAKLMQNLAVIIDHSVLQEAINRDYIECLPDLTGVVGASEYRLTAYGEKTLLEEG